MLLPIFRMLHLYTSMIQRSFSSIMNDQFQTVTAPAAIGWFKSCFLKTGSADMFQTWPVVRRSDQVDWWRVLTLRRRGSLLIAQVRRDIAAAGALRLQVQTSELEQSNKHAINTQKIISAKTFEEVPYINFAATINTFI